MLNKIFNIAIYTDQKLKGLIKNYSFHFSTWSLFKFKTTVKCYSVKFKLNLSLFEV